MKKLWTKLAAAWRAFYVHSDIWVAGRLYMRRWRFMPDWLPGLRVHNILVGDDGRSFLSHVERISAYRSSL